MRLHENLLKSRFFFLLTVLDFPSDNLYAAGVYFFSLNTHHLGHLYVHHSMSLVCKSFDKTVNCLPAF